MFKAGVLSITFVQIEIKVTKFCPYFFVFGLNTERYGVSPGKYGMNKCEKVLTRKTPNTDAFYAVKFAYNLPLYSFFYTFYL